MNTINTQELINFLINQQDHKDININNLYNLFINKLKLHNRTGTIKAYKAVLKPVLKYLNENNITYTKYINNETVMLYISTRINKVSNTTINKEICTLKTMLKFALDNDYIDKIPFKYKKLKETKNKIESINKEDINKILNYFKNCKRDKKYILAFLLILTTGIRTNELINIKNNNIDINNKIIKLDFTKNGKERNIYIIDEIVELIKLIRSDNLYLFNDLENNQMTCNNIRCFFKHIKQTLNISVLSPHKLRHFYATTIYNKSLDIFLTSKLLGHSDIKMTEIYLDINNLEHQNKNQIYNPINDFIQA